MKKWLGLFLLSSCAVMPKSNAEEVCLDVFHSWLTSAARCGLEPTSPDDSVCDRAYSYDEDAAAACLGWIDAAPCDELNNDVFQARCGKAIYIRTW
jgi:hypothetical protein